MGLKTSGAGYFQIPTEPAAGTSVTSGAANVYTTTYVQLIASTAAAIYIVGVYVQLSSTSKPTYINVRLATGGAGSETIVSDLVVPIPDSTSGAAGQQSIGYVPLPFPIPVATTTRIAVKTADSVGALAALITLQCINQSNVVDTGINESVNVLQWNSANVATPATAGIPDINVKNMNNVAATSITTINANQGTTQPINFTGTGASALAKSDMVDVAGAAVSATTAQLGVNVVNWNNTVVATPITSGVPLVDWTPSPAELTGTATASSATGITLAAAASATANFYSGMTILITSGTGKGQARLISSYTTGRVATVTPSWTTTPAATATYIIFPHGPAELEGVLFGNSSTGAAVTAATAGILDVNIKNINNAAVATGTAQIGVNVVNWAGGAAPATSITGVPKVDLQDILGTAVFTPATAGILDVNLKNIANAAVSTSNAQLGVNAVNWAGGAIPAPNVTGIPKVDLVDVLGGAVPTVTTTGVLKVDVQNWTGTAVTTPDIAGSPKVTITTGTGAGLLDFTTGVVKANTTQWLSGTIPAVNITGVPLVDTKYLLGTVYATPATAGIIDVNLKNIAGSVVSTSTAQLGVNAVNWAGGVIPAPNVTGVPKVDVVDWLGSAPNALNAGRVDAIASIRSSTAQTGSTSSTIKLDGSASATDNFYNDCLILTTGGTGPNQVRAVLSYVGSTKIATIYPNWTTTPANDTTFTIIPAGQVDLGSLLSIAVSTPATAGILDVNVKNYNNQSAQSDANNLPKVDIEDIKGTAVSTSIAQLGVNIVNIAGSASVGSAGYVGIDWGQVTNKTTTVGLTNTTISTTQIAASVSGSVNSVTSSVTVGTNNDKLNYTLSSVGLDNISIADPNGVATSFAQMLVQLWRRFFKKATLTSTQLKTYKDDNTTIETTQTVSDDGTTQTQNSAT